MRNATLGAILKANSPKVLGIKRLPQITSEFQERFKLDLGVRRTKGLRCNGALMYDVI